MIFSTGAKIGIFIDGRIVIARFVRRAKPRRVEIEMEDGTKMLVAPKRCRVIKEGVV